MCFFEISGNGKLVSLPIASIRELKPFSHERLQWDSLYSPSKFTLTARARARTPLTAVVNPVDFITPGRRYYKTRYGLVISLKGSHDNAAVLAGLSRILRFLIPTMWICCEKLGCFVGRQHSAIRLGECNRLDFGSGRSEIEEDDGVS